MVGTIIDNARSQSRNFCSRTAVTRIDVPGAAQTFRVWHQRRRRDRGMSTSTAGGARTVTSFRRGRFITSSSRGPPSPNARNQHRGSIAGSPRNASGTHAFSPEFRRLFHDRCPGSRCDIRPRHQSARRCRPGTSPTARHWPLHAGSFRPDTRRRLRNDSGTCSPSYRNPVSGRPRNASPEPGHQEGGTPNPRRQELRYQTPSLGAIRQFAVNHIEKKGVGFFRKEKANA